MSDYMEYLDVAVLQENKPVTYKSLARAVGIHVNKAKQVLYEFSEAHQDVRAIYCITGILLKSNQFNIQLVKDAKLEDAKKGYKEISGVHVYSITSFDPEDFSIFYSACRDAPKLTIEDRVKCGILKNSNVALRNTASTARKATNETQTSTISKTKPLTSNISSKPAAPTTNIVSNETKSNAKSSKPSKPSKPSSDTPAAAKRKGTLNFGPSITKKQAVASSAKMEEPVSKPVAKKSIAKMKPKNEHDDLDVRMAKTSIKASDIFSDEEEHEEDEEDEDEEEEKEEVREPEPEEDLEIEEDLEVEEEKEDVNMDTDEEKREPSAPVSAAAPSGKARRKVLKKKTTKNSRGFLVTEEVWEWETVDEDEIKSSTPTAALPSKALTAQQNTKKSSKAVKNAKKPTGQSNLFSFFKKA
ncbi:DNA polymerase subunit Cdc27 [Parasitella parasitica]|nr:DNA polymerase subunit Cdc27 [Parasitella parasitica]